MWTESEPNAVDEDIEKFVDRMEEYARSVGNLEDLHAWQAYRREAADRRRVLAEEKARPISLGVVLGVSDAAWK